MPKPSQAGSFFNVFIRKPTIADLPLIRCKNTLIPRVHKIKNFH
jgi:hypothetical protein